MATSEDLIAKRKTTITSRGVIPIGKAHCKPQGLNFCFPTQLLQKHFGIKGKGKVCIRAKWPTRPELIPFSSA